jgi:predicted heme/steroid binding protein
MVIEHLVKARWNFDWGLRKVEGRIYRFNVSVAYTWADLRHQSQSNVKRLS